MNKFKVGSKLRVVSNESRGDLTIGDVHTVTVDSGECVKTDLCPNWSAYERFDPVASARTLKGDNKLVFKALSDGVSWSVSELEEFIKTHSNRQPTAATITARIRDLRKPIYGGFRIDRTQQGKNHFYKLVQGV